MPPKTAEQIIPTVVVVVANANPGLPTRPCQAGFLRHIGEGPVAIVLKKLGSWRFPLRPSLPQPRTVGQVDVQPTVVVVVKEGDAASFGFNDVAFAIACAPNVGSVESSLLRHVYKLDCRRGT